MGDVKVTAEPHMNGLEKVLDDHRRGESGRDCIEGVGWVWACLCDCGWNGPDQDHQSHLASAISAYLLSDEVVTRVARALCESVNPGGHGWAAYRADWLRDARAALTAATEES